MPALPPDVTTTSGVITTPDSTTTPDATTTPDVTTHHPTLHATLSKEVVAAAPESPDNLPPPLYRRKSCHCHRRRCLARKPLRDCVVSSLSTDGSYSVSFIQKHIDNCMIANSLPSTRWCKIIPRKVNIFMWRLLLDRLPHRLNLSSRGLDIDSILCPVCSEHVKSNSHAFFSCSAASNI
ncbi:reverse transcriptase domain, reverse transcriptase zinc-binding domain protein [Tanacetum coccineum]